jgi:hypothetical protein
MMIRNAADFGCSRRYRLQRCARDVGATNRAQRREWLEAPDQIAALDPAMVIAGHKRPGSQDRRIIFEQNKEYL